MQKLKKLEISEVAAGFLVCLCLDYGPAHQLSSTFTLRKSSPVDNAWQCSQLCCNDVKAQLYKIGIEIEQPCRPA